ncbi:10551_t:CDS:2, partial [Racocetra fulgida]
MPQFAFNPNRLKIHLKLAVNRLKLVQQKKNVLNKQARKDIAALLENSKEESAKIRVCHCQYKFIDNGDAGTLLRTSFGKIWTFGTNEVCFMVYISVDALLMLFCATRHCDPSISEAVNTLIYAAPRSEIKELSLVRDQLIAKFGKEFALNAIENKNNCVNEK